MGTIEIEKFIEKLRNDDFITLETTPPHEPTITPLITKLASLELSPLIDGFSVTDNPLAKLKYDSLTAAIRLQQSFDKPVITTMTMRDKNRIALQSQLLGANDMDVRTILAITGDPVHLSDQPNSKGVFEGDSTMLLDIIRCLNSGIDYAGHPFKNQPQTTYPFVVSNSFAKNFSHIGKKMTKKIKNGAVGIVTQPIFDIENGKTLLETFAMAKEGFTDERKNAQLILGVFPVSRLRTAQFLATHVPGIHVPDMWIEKLTKAASISEEEEAKVGTQLSCDLLKEIWKIHPKVHLMTANRFDLAKELLLTLR